MSVHYNNSSVTISSLFQEQFVLVPHVPANSNPDKLAKIAMQSRIRKYPYAKGELITMEGLILIIQYDLCFKIILLF